MHSSTRMTQSTLDSVIGLSTKFWPVCSGEHQENWFHILNRVWSSRLLKTAEAVTIKLYDPIGELRGFQDHVSPSLS